MKKGGQVDVALLYSRLQVGHCIMDGIKFEFNDIISLYKKNDSEWRQYVSIGLRRIIYISMVLKIKFTYNRYLLPILNSKLIISQYPLGTYNALYINNKS